MSVKKLAVADAYANNTLVLHETEMGCCPGDLKVCKYVAIPTAVTNVTAITLQVNGVDTLFTFDAAANTAKEVRVAIAKALRDAGYDPYYEDTYKGVQVVDNEIHIIGEAVPVSAVVDGNTVNFTARCTMAKVCNYQVAIPYDTVPGALTYNDVEGTAVTGGGDGFATGEEGAFKTELVAALATDSVPYTLVTVTDSGTLFIVDFHLVGEATIALGAFDGALRNCYPDFTA